MKITMILLLALAFTLSNYKERMKEEYIQLKDRYTKLHKMLVKAEAGTLDFTPMCPLELLREQKRHMGEYLHILEIRAEMECVDLESDKTTCREIANT